MAMQCRHTKTSFKSKPAWILAPIWPQTSGAWSR